MVPDEPRGGFADIRNVAAGLLIVMLRVMTDGIVTIRPPEADDTETLIAGRDDEWRRWLGPGTDDPRPTACIVVAEGVVGWVDFDADRHWLRRDEVNIGYNVFAPYRGNGYATRALALLIRHLAQATPFRTATLLIHPDNAASLAVAAKSGFAPRGEIEGSRYFKRPVFVAGRDQPAVEDAIALAAVVHRGQRYASPETEPYVFHPLRLMLRFGDAVEQMASVLHDAIEDTDLTLDDLVDAGYPTAVIAALDCLTHRDDETYDQYIARVAGNDVARRVKVQDLRDNLANNRRLPRSSDVVERIERYERALERLGAPVP